MQVIFQTKSKEQNRYSIENVEGHGKVYFLKGVKMTTDKDLIKKLMNLPQYDRGDYYLVTNEKKVADYLDGKESDVLTDELLDNLKLEGVKRLGQIISAKSEQPTLIKVEAKGYPITNQVQEILDFYTLKEEENEKPKKAETFEPKLSTDMNANEAVEHIVATDKGNLEGFVPEDEDRKTVLKAWNDKFGDE